MVHNSKVVSFASSVKITEKLSIRVLECWPASALSDKKRIDVLSVLKKKLLKKQRDTFFWTTRYFVAKELNWVLTFVLKK